MISPNSFEFQIHGFKIEIRHILVYILKSTYAVKIRCILLSLTGVLSDKKSITNSELKMFETTQNIMENTSSSELLVVGPGHLGARVATLWKTRFISLMSSSSHIRSILIGIECQNCRRTLDAYLLFVILLGQI